MSDERRSVTVVGGTFFLCFWLFWCQLELGDIEKQLSRIADAVEAMQKAR